MTGASGLLGHSLCRYLQNSGHDVIGTRLAHSIDLPGVEEVNLDLLNLQLTEQTVTAQRPDIVVHCAGLTSVDECEENEDLAKHLHADVTASLSAVCQKIDAKMVYISTDHLWDGSSSFVREDQPCDPINVYARTKYYGELRAAESCEDSLIIRTNFFGTGRPWRKSLSDWIIDNLKSGKSIPAFTDSFFTPIDLINLSSILEMMVAEKATGVYNLAGRERVSKYDFAHRLASLLGFDVALIKPALITDAKLTAPRPLDMSLDVGKIEKFLGLKMPNLDECLNMLAVNQQTAVPLN